jgi:polar amino acid transport system permease protein
MLGGFLLGAVLAGMRLSRFRTVRYLSLSFVEIVRATPQLMVIFWIYLSFPALTGHAMNAWMAAAVALSLIASAYLAEVIRGGLFSIPIEQKETAALLGLSSMQVFVFVLMPQACRNMLPALIATTIMMFKTTSLVFVIGLVDFFRAAMIVNNREFAPLTCFTVVALGYFLCCYALSSLLRFFDPRYTITS